MALLTRSLWSFAIAVSIIAACGLRAVAEDKEAISPKDGVIQLFNGKNLDGLYTWLQDAKYKDPRKVFTVENGVLHISGDGFGYVATKQAYKNYHLVVEYRWGEKVYRSRIGKARDSGVIVHCVEPDGSFYNMFMAGIEVQIIEGGTGDLLAVPGKRADGSAIAVSLTSESTKGENGENYWKKGGQRITIHGGRIDWWGRDAKWKDEVNFRGKQDIESPGKEWTRLDVVCDGGHLTYRVNGKLANEAFDLSPSSGKLLFQCEGAEVFLRRFELHPLEK